jgi:hypothetical protein
METSASFEARSAPSPYPTGRKGATKIRAILALIDPMCDRARAVPFVQRLFPQPVGAVFSHLGLEKPNGIRTRNVSRILLAIRYFRTLQRYFWRQQVLCLREPTRAYHFRDI